MKYIYKITGKVSLILYIYVVSILASMSIWWLEKAYTDVGVRYNRIGWHSGSLADFEKA